MKKCLSQEALKAIACISMLLDHIGAVLLPWPWLRAAGRLAFPIYCFLLCQGLRHTRSPGRYLLRLAVVALLAELPFDLLFYGELTFAHQNVMFTLILGFLAAKGFEKVEEAWLRAAIVALAALLAQALGTDYGGMGVLLILAMYLTADLRIWALVLVAMCLGQSWVQIFGLLALIPIGAYSGAHSGRGKWFFYLYYPAHLTALLFMDILGNLNFPLT